MSSHSSNNDMEVINPEDLEESPPPTDIVNEEEIQGGGEPEPMASAGGDVETVGEITESEVKSEVDKIESVEKEEEEKEETSDKVVGEIEESKSEEVKPIVVEDEDPPIEILEAPSSNPEPVIAKEEPAAPTAASVPASNRPVVTVERPAATLEEVDDEEEDDDDIDETLTERLIGLTEMFPDFVRNGTVSLVKGSWSLTQSAYSFSKAASWVVFSSATILFMPVMIESERLQLQDQQKAQKNQILLGPGAAVSGGPSLGPPPI